MSAAASPIPPGPMPRSFLRPDASLSGVSARAIEIARHYAGGLGHKEVAARFGIAHSIAVRELQRFRDATGACSRRDIVLACRQLGLEPV